MVLGWVISDGNRGRGDRANLFKDDFEVAGVGVHAHYKYDLCASMIFATEFIDYSFNRPDYREMAYGLDGRDYYCFFPKKSLRSK